MLFRSPEQLEFLLWTDPIFETRCAEARELVKSQRIDPNRFGKCLTASLSCLCLIFFLAEVIRKYENLIKETAENNKEWGEGTIMEVEGNREKRDEMAILRIALTSKKVSLTVKYMRYIFT